MKKNFSLAGLVAVFTLIFACAFTSCMTTQTMQYGVEGDDTIALNIDYQRSYGGRIFVTHINGEMTGAYYKPGFMSSFDDWCYVNPCYIKLNGKPITFTIQCPVITGHTTAGEAIVTYKTTELRLTKLSDLKPGDVLTLRWMYQTQTFAFIDATGGIVQQTIPIFN